MVPFVYIIPIPLTNCNLPDRRFNLSMMQVLTKDLAKIILPGLVIVFIFPVDGVMLFW